MVRPSYSMYAMRITAPWEHIKSKLKDIKGLITYDGMMVGFHIGKKTKKPHAHFAIKLKIPLQKPSFDLKFVKLFGVAKGDFSSKAWDGDDQYLRYLFHDPEGEVINEMGIPAEKMKQLKAESDIQTQAANDKRKTASTKIPEYVLKHINETGNKMTMDEIGWFIFQAVHKGLYHNPSNSHLEKYINEIMCKQCETENELGQAWIIRRNQMYIFRQNNF